ERIGERARELDGSVDAERAPVEALAQRPALEERHDDVERVRRPAAIEDRDEAVRLSERREEARLALVPRRDERSIAAEELQRDRLPARSAGAVDGPHPSGAERVEERVRTDLHVSRDRRLHVSEHVVEDVLRHVLEAFAEVDLLVL